MSRPARSRPSPRLRFATMSLALLVAVGLLAVIPTAVAAQDEQSPGSIEGSIWQLLEYRDQSGSIEELPPGVVVTALLWFEDLSGEGACSTYDSSYTLQKEVLIIDEPKMTRRACDSDAQAIDDAFYGNLTQTATYVIDGSVLEFRDVVGEPLMTFTKAIIPTDPTIAPWELARIAAADGSMGPVIAGTSPSVQFLRGGRVVGTTGCGWFVGSYTTNDSIMRVSDVSSSEDECTPELQQQAASIVSTFDGVADFQVLPAGLTLSDDSGAASMTLVPAISLGRRTWTPIQILDTAGESLVRTDRLANSSIRFSNQVAAGRTICRNYKAGSLRSGLALTVYDIDVDFASGKCRKKARPSEAISQQAVERIWVETLAGVASHALRGSELELMNANGVPVVRLIPQPEFAGVPWALTEMPDARGKLESLEKGSQITATFEDGIGVVQGDTGKNPYFANFSTPSASTIDINDFLVTGSKCEGARRSRLPLCKQEQRYKKALVSADSFVVSDRGLELRKGSKRILAFQRQRPQDDG
jgi:heat shock protein HslJ